MKKQSNLVKSDNVIQLGDHILVCGDASTVDLKTILGARQINAIVTDPPYGIDYVASKRGLQKVSKDKDIQNDGHVSDTQYQAFTKAWLVPALLHLTKKNSIYIFNSDKMVFALREACVDLKIKVAQLLIWVKDKAVIGRLDYLPQHELILYGWYGTHDFKHGKDKSVLFAPKPQKSSLHPTTKPVSLIRKLILNCTNVGDVVYDPFGGSGTTLIACEHTKRRCVMVEKDLEYCETIVRRWEKLTGKKAHGRQED